MSALFEESARAVELQAEVDSATSTRERVQALLAFAAHLDIMNRTADAADVVDEACDLVAGCEDAELVGWTFHRRMVIRSNGGLFDAAAADGVIAFDAFARAGHVIGQARAISARADALLRLERYEEGFPLLIEATLMLEAIDELDVEVMNVTFVISEAYAAVAAYEDSIALAERGLALAERLDDRAEVLWGRYRLADVLIESADAIATSEPDRARSVYERTCAILDAIDPATEAASEAGLRSLLDMLRGIALMGCGRPADAVGTLLRARQLSGRLDQSPLENGRLERGLGRAYAAMGDPTLARDHFDEAVEAFAHTESHVELADALRERSKVIEVVGDFSDALDDLRRALQIREAQRVRETARRADSVTSRIDVERRRIELRKHERIADELRRMAGEDPLTAIANRRTLDIDGGALISACGAGIVSLAIIDVDNFKAINDVHSHLVGDAVLKRLAEILSAQIRPSDLVARYAGDEFVLVLPGLDAAAAESLRVRVQHATDHEHWEHIAPGLTVTTSIGLATGVGRDGLWPMFADADAALYDAKRAC